MPIPEVQAREPEVWCSGNFEPTGKSQAPHPAGPDASCQRQSQGCNSYNWKKFTGKKREVENTYYMYLCPYPQTLDCELHREGPGFQPNIEEETVHA